MPEDNDKSPRILFQSADGTETVEVSMKDFKAMIREAVSEELEHRCRIPLDAEQIKEVGHLFGMVKDVGKQDLSMGVEEMRQNHQWMAKLRGTGEKIGTGLLLIILGAITTGLGSMVWLGFKHMAASLAEKGG